MPPGLPARRSTPVTLPCLGLVCGLALMTPILARAQPATAADAADPSGDTPRCEPAWPALSAVRRLQATLRRSLQSAEAFERAGAWSDVSTLAEAVMGPGDERLQGCEVAATHTAPALTPDVAVRDRAAYGLLALGYSARETADIVSGRITRQALDTARRLIMAGRGRESAAAYLDAQYEQARWQEALAAARSQVIPPIASAFEPLIEQHARAQGISAALVKAVVQTESAFKPFARSRAGAAGLMQLMPATARELGVNPWIPEQNVEGGVRYLSGLLREFGTTELALIAYNGGPGFARRYVRGEAALYGETREYVRRVSALLRSREPATVWR